ncbi:MAG: MnhB domain-containing protein [Candidatus Omnitrophica bacterium]|nr:MnhB domain-containing protein [Candidatus Omnitrophota bacterium]
MSVSKRHEEGMTFIVKTVTKITLGFILLYGIFISVGEHNSPGSGFAGGVIVALSFVHIMLAFGREAARNKLRLFSTFLLISTAAAVFLLATVKSFIKIPYFLLTMPLCETVVVGGGLFVVFITLVLIYKEK